MRSWSLAFFVGTLCLITLPVLPPLSLGIFLFSLILLIHIGNYYYSLKENNLPPFSKSTWRLINACLLGFIWALIYAHHLCVWQLPSDLENKPITLIGKIAAIPTQKNKGVSFEFKVEQLNNTSAEFTTLLSWYAEQLPTLHVGDRWHLLVKLKKPHGLANPGSFDYERWLFQQNISATGYVLSKKTPILLSTEKSLWHIDHWRQLLNEQITLALQEVPSNGIIRALVLGIRDGISTSQWQLFQATGTSHLIAISGLHIGLAASACFFLLQWLWRRSSRLCTIYPAQQAGACAAILGAALYAGLSGFAIPAQRSLIMISAFMLTLCRKALLLPWSSWCLALLGVLIINPLAPLSAGFWLSFAAVAVIIYSTHQRLGKNHAWQSAYRVQIAVSLCLLPLGLWLFQQTSLISLFANLIAIPWVSFIVVPLSLIGTLLICVSFPLGQWVLILAAYLMQLLEWPLKWMTYLPYHQWLQPIDDYRHLIALTLGSLLLLAPRGWPGRWLGVIGFIPLLSFTAPQPQAGEAWLTVLDVGQGLAAVIRTQHHVLIYDTGPKFSLDSDGNADAGGRVITPFLLNQQIKYIDTIVISHPDMDHRGGLNSVLQKFPVKKLYLSEKHPRNLLNNTTVLLPTYQFCNDHQQWQWDGVHFAFLHPDPTFQLPDTNNHSCVLKVTVGNKSILLSGDIEKKAEKHMITKLENNLKATILIAPHHGSKSSSSKLFIEKVSPRYVVFTTGYLNRYHFPNAQIVTQYKNAGATIYNTAETGALNFILSPQKALVEPTLFRHEHSFIWQKREEKKKEIK